MADFNFFLPLAKIDEERRLVSGYASTPARDSDGEVITLEAIKAALPDYLAYGNIREMHKLNAVGVAAETNVDKKGLYLTAYIADDAAWKKCLPTTLPDGTKLPPVYKGFSIGGRKLAKVGNKITELDMNEISIVDRPSNPECRIDIAKSQKEADEDDGGYLVKVKKQKRTAESKAVEKLAKVIGNLAKAGPPAAHDGFSLPAIITGQHPDGVVSVNDSRPNENVTRKAGADMICEKHGKANCSECSVEKAQEASKPKGDYGDVEYADPGHQADKKPRYPIDTEEHIRAAWNYIHKKKNAAKYSSDAHVAGIKSRIVAAWKAKIDKDGPPAKEGKEVKKAIEALELVKTFDLGASPTMALPQPKKEDPYVLRKSMNSAGSLSYAFDSIRGTQRSLLMEGKKEGGDSKDKALSKKLGEIAKELAAVISQKALHEGDEAITLTDADDVYLASLLGEGFYKMDKNNEVSENDTDALAQALESLLAKRAAGGANLTKKQRMEMADENCSKARKAMKAARSAIEEAHAMHKAAYIAKAAGKGKDKDDDNEFDHTGAMEKLQKAYQEIDKARTFNKAARAQLEKLARSGQRGEEANDPQSGFYEVPPGVTDLTPNAMSGAAPGTKNGGGQPPVYPGDGSVYAGKAAGSDNILRKYAKNGVISAAVAELLMKQAAQEGELEALRRIPASAVDGRRRPFAFDLTKAVGSGGGKNASPQDLQKALFEGVDVSAINGNDERAHVAETAKVIGNLLTNGNFGKSVLSPEFRGAAGTH